MAEIQRMADRLARRGPDDAGTWCDPQAGIALGHRRLSVLDLSPQGHQPMVSHCGRYVIVLNGEIYNHLDLRQRLDPIDWRGHSDTETLLACFSRWGVRDTLPLTVGMFAFAVWDREERRLTLARDRMGEKPLYWGTLPSGEFVFASELKALRAHPNWAGEVDRDALALFLRHDYVPAPRSIYRGIGKLQPGRWLSVAADGRREEGEYWSLPGAARSGEEGRGQPLSDAAAVERLEALLGDAVRQQLLSDVPLGAFLSGGVDSSTVVALMTRHATARVRTFTIGFDEAGFNEAEHAKAVARHLGTEHTELYVSAADALSVIPQLPAIYDEPFADASQVPTFLVARMARERVTVALSGDGGDELFLGYNRYLLARRVWRALAPLPLGLRRALSRFALAVQPRAWDLVARAPMALLPRRRRLPEFGDKLHKFASSVLTARSEAEMYRALVSRWQDPASVVLHAAEPATLLSDDLPRISLADSVERMSLADQLTYLPDDILVKVDRAAMAVSLETRVPLLDHRVVEFAWQTPLAQKIRGGQGKWLLRQVLYRHVPRELIERPKQGFAIPLGQWLRGPLHDWAEALLSPARLRTEGFLDPSQVRERWREHCEGRRNWQYALWNVLMFQSWLEAERRER